MVCWGSDSNGQAAPPAVGSPWRSVAAGANATCGVLEDASLHCWGAFSSGAATIPAPFAPVLVEQPPLQWLSITFGGGGVCVLGLTHTYDNMMACWGMEGWQSWVYPGQEPPSWAAWIKDENTTAIALNSDALCHLSVYGGALTCLLLGNTGFTMEIDTQVGNFGLTSIDKGGGVACYAKLDHSIACSNYVYPILQSPFSGDPVATVAITDGMRCALLVNGRGRCFGDALISTNAPYVEAFVQPTPSPSPTSSPSTSPSPSSSSSPTPSLSPSSSPSPSHSPSPSVTPSISISPTQSPTPSPSSTPLMSDRQLYGFNGHNYVWPASGSRSLPWECFNATTDLIYEKIEAIGHCPSLGNYAGAKFEIHVYNLLPPSITAITAQTLNSTEVASLSEVALPVAGGEILTLHGTFLPPSLQEDGFGVKFIELSVAVGTCNFQLLQLNATETSISLPLPAIKHTCWQRPNVTAFYADISVTQKLFLLDGSAGNSSLQCSTAQCGPASFIQPLYIYQACTAFRSGPTCLDEAYASECGYLSDIGCEACPPNAVCPGGHRIWPMPGYWNAHDGDTRVVQCKPPAMLRCPGRRSGPGGSNCGPGFAGAIEGCGACAEDYYEEDGICLQCDQDNGFLAILPLAMVVVFSLATFSVIWLLVHTLFKRHGIPATRPRMLKIAFDFVTWFLVLAQLVVQVGRTSTPGMPQWVRSIIDELSILQLDFGRPVHLECINEVSLTKEYLPLIAGVVLYSLWWVGMGISRFERRFKASNTRWMHKIPMAVIWLRYVALNALFILYSLMMTTVFSVLKCEARTTTGGGQVDVWKSHPTIACHSSDHLPLVILSWLVLFTMALTLPVTLWYIHLRRITPLLRQTGIPIPRLAPPKKRGRNTTSDDASSSSEAEDSDPEDGESGPEEEKRRAYELPLYTGCCCKRPFPAYLPYGCVMTRSLHAEIRKQRAWVPLYGAGQPWFKPLYLILIFLMMLFDNILDEPGYAPQIFRRLIPFGLVLCFTYIVFWGRPDHEWGTWRRWPRFVVFITVSCLCLLQLVLYLDSVAASQPGNTGGSGGHKLSSFTEGLLWGVLLTIAGLPIVVVLAFALWLRKMLIEARAQANAQDEISLNPSERQTRQFAWAELGFLCTSPPQSSSPSPVASKEQEPPVLEPAVQPLQKGDSASVNTNPLHVVTLLDPSPHSAPTSLSAAETPTVSAKRRATLLAVFNFNNATLNPLSRRAQREAAASGATAGKCNLWDQSDQKDHAVDQEAKEGNDLLLEDGKAKHQEGSVAAECDDDDDDDDDELHWSDGDTENTTHEPETPTEEFKDEGLRSTQLEEDFSWNLEEKEPSSSNCEEHGSEDSKVVHEFIADAAAAAAESENNDDADNSTTEGAEKFASQFLAAGKAKQHRMLMQSQSNIHHRRKSVATLMRTLIKQKGPSKAADYIQALSTLSPVEIERQTVKTYSRKVEAVKDEDERHS